MSCVSMCSARSRNFHPAFLLYWTSCGRRPEPMLATTLERDIVDILRTESTARRIVEQIALALSECSGCFRLERLPGGSHPLESAAWHGAHVKRLLQIAARERRKWPVSEPCRATPIGTVPAEGSRWMFGRIFGLDGRESYRELRLEPLCCPHRLSRETAPHEREYPRRKDRF